MVTVTAQTAAAKTASDYRGTVSFSSSDPTATLPASYTFTTADGGSHAFSMTLTTLGAQTLTVSDAKTEAHADLSVVPACANFSGDWNDDVGSIYHLHQTGTSIAGDASLNADGVVFCPATVLGTISKSGDFQLDVNIPNPCTLNSWVMGTIGPGTITFNGVLDGAGCNLGHATLAPPYQDISLIFGKPCDVPTGEVTPGSGAWTPIGARLPSSYTFDAQLQPTSIDFTGRVVTEAIAPVSDNCLEQGKPYFPDSDQPYTSAGGVGGGALPNGYEDTVGIAAGNLTSYRGSGTVPCTMVWSQAMTIDCSCDAPASCPVSPTMPFATNRLSFEIGANYVVSSRAGVSQRFP